MTLLGFLLLFVTLVHQTNESRATIDPKIDAHLQDVLRTLPEASTLYRELQNGARGDGIHYVWMDDMRRQGIKRVIIQVNIQFGRSCKPKEMKVGKAFYYKGYNGESDIIVDADRIEQAKESGLEEKLSKVALQRAAQGSWVDVPRPKPQPFVGATSVELLDDEWLPLRQPLFGADPSASPH